MGMWLLMQNVLKRNHRNIERHTAHTIVSWPNPKQTMLVKGGSDLLNISSAVCFSFDQFNENIESRCEIISNHGEPLQVTTWGKYLENQAWLFTIAQLRGCCETKICCACLCFIYKVIPVRESTVIIHWLECQRLRWFCDQNIRMWLHHFLPHTTQKTVLN